MEYQVSALKYRPMTFASVVGQEALTTTLKNAIKSNKLAHAFLFCGPRGVGKTTCARIFAKTINCEHPTADGEACGECESCRAFLEQRSYNIFELDAASNNSVENIKQLMEQTRIPPQIGKYKVFIIDEVHMLSTQAFNAFLKTLEEPPSYVIFILATTEKNKLLPTIISRCQIYDFDRMTVANTVNHLKMVAEREGYTYEEEALELIAEKADGGMRDALSIFDQAASFCQGDITVEKVSQDLNLLDVENYFSVVDMSLQNKCTDIMLLLNKMLSDGMDGGNIVVGLAAHVRNVLMAKDPQTVQLIETSKKYRERYADQAARCPVAFLYKALQILTRCDLNYKQSSNKRLLVELTLIEVAQITQPEDAADGGPRKGRRLKSLFKKLMLAQNKTAGQVAVVADDKKKSATEPLSTANVPQDDSPRGGGDRNPAAKTDAGQTAPAGGDSTGGRQYPTADNGRLKSSAIINKLKTDNAGSTFSSLRMKKNSASENEGGDVTDITAGGLAESFTDADLRLQWMAMCNRMLESSKEYHALASSMRNLTPVITQFPDVEVIVTNNILLDQLQTIRKRILLTLRNHLHNNGISLTLRLAENGEVQRALTKGELFDKMKAESPQLRTLVSSLGLELV